MSTIATAYVQVLPSTKGIKGALTSEFSGIGTDVGKSAGGNIASGISGALTSKAMLAIGAVAGTAIIKGISSSVKEGGNLEQSIGGIQTLFKDSANTVMKNAASAWKTAGISANEYMEQTTSFGASLIKSLGGDTVKAAKLADTAILDMSDNANKFGTDIGMIQNAYQGFAKGNFTMLDNLKLGYGGTKQEMQKLLQEASKLSGMHYDIDNFADIVSAIHDIQTELGVTGTTAKEAASTITGSFQGVKSTLSNLMGGLALGGDISGLVDNFADSFGTFLNDNLLPMIDNIVSNLPDLFSGLIENLVSGDGLSDAVSKMTQIAGKLVKALVSGFGELAAAAPIILMKLVEGLLEAAPELAKAVPAMIQALAEAIPKYAPEIAKEIPKLVIAMAEALVMSAVYLLQGLGEMMVQLVEAVPGYAAEMGEAFREMGGTIGSAISSWGSNISAAVAPAVDVLKSAFGPSIQGIAAKLGPLVSSFQNMFAQIGSFAQACANLLGTIFAPVATKIGSAFQSAVSMIKSAFAPIGSFMKQIGQTMVSAISTAIAQFRGIGKQMIDNLKAGIVSAANSAINAIKNIVDGIANMFKNLTQMVNNATMSITSSANTASRAASSATSMASGNVSRTYSAAPMSAQSYGAYSQSYSSAPKPVNVNVTLSGSAKNVFDSVRVENTKLVNATGYKALA